MNQWRKRRAKKARRLAAVAAAALMTMVVTMDLPDFSHRQVNGAGKESPATARVAVIVAGTLKRFLINSTAGRMIRPMVFRDRVRVDCYVSLTTEQFVAYHSGGYMERLVPDPALPIGVPPAEAIAAILGEAGATATAVRIEESIDVDGDERLAATRKKATAARPEEDPDARFPVLDVSSAAMTRRTADANRNLLRLHRATQDLWRAARRREEEEGVAYDVVVFLRDDTHWLADFSVRPFLDGGDADVFIPSCDARVPRMLKSEVNDHLLISRRGTAGIFGEYYSRLFEIDLDDCKAHCGLPRSRGCNSEMLLKHVMGRAGLNVTGVPQSAVPFQRSALVRGEDGAARLCFHKFCQSQAAPLDLAGVDVPRCREVRL